MFKIIILYLLYINPILAIASPYINTTMSFKEFAKLSAILNQCELKESNKKQIMIISKEQGLKLARRDKLSNDRITHEVAYILYELDEKYQEKIPESVCENNLKKFQQYIKDR